VTHPSHLRPLASSQHAFEDAELPGLSMALHAPAASALFEDRWRAEGDHRLRASATRVHNVRYEPGQRCRIAWEVEVSSEEGRARDTLGVIEIRPETSCVRGFWEDPDLPQLAEAVTPARATHHLSSFAPGSAVERVHPAQYHPGSRCTLRYDMTGSAMPPVLFGKVLSSDAGYLLDVAQAIRGSVTEGHRSPIVEPLGWCEPLRMLLLSPCVDATELHEIVFDPAVPAERRRRWTCEAGSTLARLHAAPVSGLGWRGIGDDLAELQAAGDVVATCAPATWPVFDAALERLSSLPWTEQPRVTSHGAFRTDQLLAVDGRAVMVDLDGLCLADPARDIGNLLAYLRWKAIRQPHHAAFIHEAAGSFLQGYGRLARLPDGSRIAVHQAASMLKIAERRFQRLEVTTWPLVPRLVEEASELLRSPHRRRLEAPGAEIIGAVEGARSGARPSRLSGALAEALDPDAMRDRLAPLLPEPGSPDSVRDSAYVQGDAIATAEILTHRPGRRSTIRYAHDGGAPTLIGKLYADLARGRRAHGVMRWLWEHRHAGSSELGVPRPLGWLPDLGMLVYVPVDGRGLGELLRRPQDGSRAADALDRTADWLGELHRRRVPLDRMFEPERELATVRGWATAIGDRYPDLGDLGAGIVTRLEERAPDLDVRSAVPIHKDFRHDHVFVDDAIRVIDFDEVRLGDSAFDLGHFCAYLRVMERPHDGDHRQVAWLQDRFLNAYRRATGWKWDDRLSSFIAYGCLKIAWQLAVRSYPAHRAGEEIAHRKAAAMLREAARSLEPAGGARPS
jgi:aminoglycoside phosphotransferase (APT) family kinase protein